MSECIFCRIVAGEIPAKEVARTADAVAFHDLNPQAPTHVLIVPTRHFHNVSQTDSDDGELALAKAMRLAVQVAEQTGVAASGYRLVLNNGRNGGQSVDHLHIHLLGGRPMRWPPG